MTAPHPGLAALLLLGAACASAFAPTLARPRSGVSRRQAYSSGASSQQDEAAQYALGRIRDLERQQEASMSEDEKKIRSKVRAATAATTTGGLLRYYCYYAVAIAATAHATLRTTTY